MLAVAGIEHRAAPGGEHDVVQRCQLLDRLGFPLAEAGFALDVEDHGNGNAGSRLDFAIGVVERLADALGELTANGGFARAHHAHQENSAVGLHEAIVATHRAPATKAKGPAMPAPLG